MHLYTHFSSRGLIKQNPRRQTVDFLLRYSKSIKVIRLVKSGVEFQVNLN
jgi:hypothetical protein